MGNDTTGMTVRWYSYNDGLTEEDLPCKNREMASRTHVLGYILMGSQSPYWNGRKKWEHRWVVYWIYRGRIDRW